jgi:hypothetical protein
LRQKNDRFLEKKKPGHHKRIAGLLHFSSPPRGLKGGQKGNYLSGYFFTSPNRWGNYKGMQNF